MPVMALVRHVICFQTIVLLCLRLSSVNCFDSKEDLEHMRLFDQHFQVQKKKSDKKSVPFERITQLYSKAGGHHVQIIGTHVNALGQDGSKYARLIIQSDNFGRVRIRSAITDHYICLAKNGRPRGVRKKQAVTSQDCVFQEYYAENYYTEFHSVNQNLGRLGFSRKGKGRRGWFVMSGHKSSQFLERTSKIIIDAEKSTPAKDSILTIQKQIARLLQVYEKKTDKKS